MIMKTNKTSWGKVAGWYDDMLTQSSDSYQEKVILPNLLRIVEPKESMTVIDIACGQGYFSRAIQEKGAKVIGCDISKELIDLAKARSLKDIEYHAASADNLSFMKDAIADVAVIVLSIQNIENIDGVFAECARILKPDGRLILVLNHPAFRVPKRSSWEWVNQLIDSSNSSISDGPKIDSSKEIQYRRIDGYMSESCIEVDMTPGEEDIKNKKTTISFHRPLQTYFKSMIKSGFAVTRLEEWISHKKSEKGKRAMEENRMRKEIPMFLCLVGRKI